jgi:alpha-beta hydrolase superfamily lysophospholipase
MAPEIGAEMFRAGDGAIMPMRSWLPEGRPKALIVALHGFADYSASFARPAGFWAENGVATVAYDQRGFGGAPDVFHWAGTARMVEDAREVTAALRHRYPGVPTFLLGESMGGALAIVATAGAEPLKVDGVVLVSPAVWERDFMGSVERSALWVVQATIPSLWLEPPRGLGIHPSNNIAILRAMAHDSLVQQGARVDTTAGLMDAMDAALADIPHIRQPTLVLYGAHEEVLPKEAVRDMLKLLPAQNVGVAEYPNGYHMLLRDLDGETVARDIMAWTADRGAKLPSGNACAGIAADSPPCRHDGVKVGA